MLLETGAIIRHAWLPQKTIVIVVSIDLGRNCCKVMLRLLNTPNLRSKDNVDIIVVFSVLETFVNSLATCVSHFRELESLQHTQHVANGSLYKPVLINSHDFKILSALYAHAGQSANYPSRLDYVPKWRLQGVEMLGGPHVKKYLAYAPSLEHYDRAVTNDGAVVENSKLGCQAVEKLEQAGVKCDKNKTRESGSQKNKTEGDGPATKQVKHWGCSDLRTHTQWSPAVKINN